MGKNVLIGLVIIMASACNVSHAPREVKKTFIHPVNGFSKTVTVTANKVITIYISGLTAEGADFATQTRLVFSSIKAELNNLNANFSDIVKMNTYIVNINPELVNTFRGIRKENLGELDLPASTIIGIPSLASKDRLIEIEAIAVIPQKKLSSKE